ncbi:cell elongation-specific peptidoglycan D,D-transpeptidase [Streptoalloteichus tenebrarius]|uniref:Cell elongation-specific peptidoglycan D,D-transpeptidase n=1 Tax=Streptoalloteichus tenebrarius (strain ATCC 17920 / DSM 40477 / JCM 4838 / CBS 697.72 / NBRC 16177 / NCIMB 11028 / NRRL B-12390 / A12253. 1 / ISP 5477) TaxID=1933 RepID=A0ABT1I2Y5_STRSD|nr:penicillin-binding protein 2 [Streptoalloteichus tenebrarius]MCP2262147.1 cell elongation-specific peptidoglycan D,D-transpeptidase [Streptoalloteichus tenebrarius]BFF01945.1 penicillin-binding protein 2 [Streptoalloteichus tenebrarius]
MNTPLRRVAMSVMVMVLLLLANATYVQVFKADEYRKDPRNQRVLLEEYSRQRGKILAGGQAVADIKETNDRLKFLRTYPAGEMYAPITGYFSPSYGSVGMEFAQDSVLNGSDDRLFVRRLSDLITGRDPRGGNVELTVDPKVQQAAYEGLHKKGFTGAVVAMDPKTGAILGMASTPSYDPNRLATHDSDEQAKAWKELNADGGRAMKNRALKEIYPPGSTFKLVVTAAALQNGYNKDSQLTAAPDITLPGTQTTLENYNHTNCGSGSTASLETALALSCNTAFAELAGAVGEQKLRQQAERFGIGTGEQQIPLGVEASRLGDIPDKAALYQTGLGQRDVRVTPLQNAVLAATIANGGARMQPYLVKSITSADLHELDATKPKKVEQAVPSSVASTVRDMMIKSERNTGGEGQISGVTIASKTGTAEHGTDPRNTNPHAWYVAFAPAENPKVAVAVIVEDGGDRGLGATGGKVAAPIGRAVIRAALQGGG